MDNIPNSYEETQEMIKSNKIKNRFTLKRTLIISFLSILTIFLVWILYPLPAPDFAIRSMLPADTAISIEAHRPTQLLQKIEEDNYLSTLQTLPVWKSLSREYKIASNSDLTPDSTAFMTDLHEKSQELLGVRNILAFAGGISYDKHAQPIYNSIVWLDNIGFLGVKLASLVQKPQNYQGINYYQVQVNSRDSLYIAPSPAYPRAVLVSTDLDSLSRFNIPPEQYLSSEFDRRDDIIEASIFPALLPTNNIFYIPDVKSGEIRVNWSIPETTCTGNITFDSLFEDNTSNPGNHFRITIPTPSLSINLNLPENTIITATTQFQTDLSQTDNPILKPLSSETNTSFISQLSDNINITISDPEDSNTNILKYTHLYLGNDNAQTAQNALSNNLDAIIGQYRKSNDLGVKILASQFSLEQNMNAIAFSIPLLPPVLTTFSTIQDISYSETRLASTPSIPASISSSTPNTLDLEWKYSSNLSESLYNSIPDRVKEATLIKLNSRHRVIMIDMLNFLSSSSFFSFNLNLEHNNNSSSIVFNSKQRIPE